MELLLSFFRQCNKENIDYCIWKSSNQLESSLNGKTDFDIFVNNSHKDIFDKLLKKNNFFFTVSSKKKEYLDNEYDAFLIDEKLNLIHFHIYSMIIIGAKNNKNYKFLFNNEIFQTSKYDNLYDIKIIDPNIEIFLLVCRFYFKLRYEKLNIKLLEELNDQYFFLKKKIIKNNLNIKLPKMNLEYNEINYETVKIFIKESDIFKKNFFQKIKRKRNGIIFSLQKRTLSKHGVSVALVGHDGSGKTTLVQSIYNLLRKKISIKKIYLGKYKKIKNKYMSSFLNLFIKLYKLILIRYYRSIGYLVIIDRYLQSEKNFNDGPILINSKLQFLSIFEKKFYKLLERRFCPDLILKIVCDTERIINRKKNLDLSVIDIKNNHIVEHNYFSKKIEYINGMNSINKNLNDIIKLIIHNGEK